MLPGWVLAGVALGGAAVTGVAALVQQQLWPHLEPGRVLWLAAAVAAGVAGIAARLSAWGAGVPRLQRTASELRETSARERAIIDASIDAIISIDERGLIQSVNPAATQMFGYAADELLGHNVNLLMPSPFAEQHDEYIRAYLRTGVKKIIGIGREVAGQRKDGTAFPVELTVTETRFAGARLFSGIIRDLTARRRAEERASTLDRILEDSLHEFYVFDDRTLQLLRVNRGARQNLGYELDELRKLTSLDLEPGLTREAFEARVAPLRRGELAKVNFQTQHRRKDGSLYRVDTYVQHYRFGDLNVFVALVVDVTERQELQAQLAQAQKAEAIGQLAGGIAHDFNNLLTSIQGSAELLAKRLPEEDRAQRALRRIQQASERGSALTNRLLAFSRRQVMSPQPLDLNTHVLQTHELAERLIGEDIEVVLELEPQLPAVQADPTQIDQILMNLVINAGDAMHGGGRLTLSTRNVELDAAAARRLAVQPGPAVCLTVRDTGVGMDQATLARIFEPFFTTKELGKGTGLGLATVYGIVKQSGWGIAVESAPGQGATFGIYIPSLGAIQAASSAARQGAARATAAGTVLLVEDDPLVREVAAEVLEAAGHRVLMASRPQEALELAARHRSEIGLLLSDVVMPEMSGLELAERLRADCPGLRVLLMSGYPDAALSSRGALPSDQPLLRKPFSNEALLDKIGEVLR